MAARPKPRPRKAPKKDRGPSTWTLASQHRPALLRAATADELARLEADRGAWLLELAGTGTASPRAGWKTRSGSTPTTCATGRSTPRRSRLTLSELPVDELVVEGFLCVLDAQGRPDFSALKARIRSGNGPPRAASRGEMLRLDGEDLRVQPLPARRERLRALLPKQRHVVFSDGLEGPAAHVRETARSMGLPACSRARRCRRAGRFWPAMRRCRSTGRCRRRRRDEPRQGALSARRHHARPDIVAYYRDVAPALLPHSPTARSSPSAGPTASTSSPGTSTASRRARPTI